MKKLLVLILIGLVAFVRGTSFSASAENARRTTPREVSAVTDISVSGNPGPLIVSFAIAGQEPSAELDNSTTYGVTNDGSTMKIAGSIDSAMPSNAILFVNLTAPTGASSSGWQTLSTSPVDLVTSIGVVDESGLTVSYRLHAPVAAGIIASAQKTVTFTIAAQ